MKKVIITFAAILIASAGWAQSPEKMSYQAVIRNSSDALLTNIQVGMQISILQSSANGTAVYTETQTPTTNANGLVSIEIGGEAGFSAIDWANDIYFIKTETDPTGGTSYSIIGTSQLLSVPYALHSRTAGIVTDTIEETDPIFDASLANDITQTDITNWNNDLVDDADADTTNEIQNIEQVLTTGNDANENTLVNVGQLAIGTSSPVPGAALEISSATGALLLPRMSTEQRDALAAEPGMLIYNTSESKFQGYSNSLGSGQYLSTGEPMGGGNALGMSATSIVWTPGTSGKVTKVKVYTGGSVSSTLSIYDNDFCTNPTNLGTSASVTSVANGWTEFVFSTPVTVSAGNTYYFWTSVFVDTEHFMNTEPNYTMIGYEGIEEWEDPGCKLADPTKCIKNEIFIDEASKSWVDLH